MPASPPTIVAPLPADPRVFALAKAVGLTRREAFGAAAEAWAWMRVMAADGLVVNTSPDSLDGLVDVDGFGQAMLEAGLVGVVDDGLVLPAELRHHERDQGGARRRAAADGHDDKAERRKEQQRVSSRRYRRKVKLTSPKPTATTDKAAWRQLGRVAGHEIRAFDGPHGVYAMVIGATIGGTACRKFTAGDKAWSLESVTLADVLPDLVAKWKTIHEKESKSFCPSPLTPAFTVFRDEAETLVTLAKYQQAAAVESSPRHVDGDDASTRHVDASSIVNTASSPLDAGSDAKSMGAHELPRHQQSDNRHVDALSSMSCLSKSSSLREEEEKRRQGRETAGMDDAHDLLDERKQAKLRIASRFADLLGMTREHILTLWELNHDLLRRKIRAAGVDPNDWIRADARAPSKPVEARADIDMTTDTTGGDNPSEGVLEARGRGDADHEHGDTLTTSAA